MKLSEVIAWLQDYRELYNGDLRVVVEEDSEEVGYLLVRTIYLEEEITGERRLIIAG